jgi:hypothetical protein
VTAFEPKPGYFRRLAHGARAKRLRWDSAIRMRSGIPPRGHFPCPFPEVRWVIDLRWIHDGHPYGLDVFETRGLPSRIQARGNADSSASLSAPAVREPIAVGSPKDSYGFIRRQVSCDVMKDSLDEFEELAQREIRPRRGYGPRVSDDGVTPPKRWLFVSERGATVLAKPMRHTATFIFAPRGLPWSAGELSGDWKTRGTKPRFAPVSSLRSHLRRVGRGLQKDHPD